MNEFVVEVIFAFLTMAIIVVEVYEYKQRKWGCNYGSKR